MSRPADRQVEELRHKLAAQLPDEAKAYELYTDLASEAENIGLPPVGTMLRHIAAQELGHRDTLKRLLAGEMYRVDKK